MEQISIQAMQAQIRKLCKEKNAVIMAHYYTQDNVQAIADFVGDSLALAQKAALTNAQIILMCGVHFMGETAKILCPDKTVLVPDMNATCSLAESCPANAFEAFIKAYPGHKVVSYVNTTAAIKALTDVVVTSSNAQQIVDTFPTDQPLIFGPDKNLGAYINRTTGRHMILWNGCCHVHDRFSAQGIAALKAQYPKAKVLVHPECKEEVDALSDHIGSTASLLAYCQKSDAQEFIVVTESGILYQMQKSCPSKTFIPAPKTEGTGCNECEYMKMITLEKVLHALQTQAPAIEVDPTVAAKAVKPIQQMLKLSK